MKKIISLTDELYGQTKPKAVPVIIECYLPELIEMELAYDDYKSEDDTDFCLYDMRYNLNLNAITILYVSTF